MAKTTYNTKKGLFVQTGTGFVFDSSTDESTLTLISPPTEAIAIGSGITKSETSGAHNGAVLITQSGGAGTLILNDGLAIGQEKIIIAATGGQNLALQNSDTSVIATIVAGNFATEDAHMCVWNGAKWQLLG